MKLIITIFLSCHLFGAFAQLKQKSFFVKFDGRIVSTLDSADYIRYVQEPKEGERSFSLFETYKNGNRKRIGKLRYYEPYLKFSEGKLISYFENGKIESVENYSHSMPYRENYYYFSNGKVKEVLDYYFKNRQPDVKIKLLNDTSGVSLLDKKASGRFIINDFNGISTTGFYHKGKRSGIWEIKNTKTKSNYLEKYKKGTLITGTNIDSLGKETIYQYLKTKPTLRNKEVEDKIENDLAPLYAKFNLKKKSLEKKRGEVILLFDINENGEPKNVKVYQSSTPKNNADAVNEIKSKNWTPAKHRGKPIYFANYIYKIYYN